MSPTDDKKNFNNSLTNFLTAAQQMAESLQSQIKELPKNMSPDQAKKYEAEVKKLKRLGIEKVNKDLAEQLKHLNKMLNFK